MYEDLSENLVGKNAEKTGHIMTILVNLIKKSKMMDEPKPAK